MDKIDKLLEALTLEDVDYFASRGVAIYLEDGALNPEFEEYLLKKENNNVE